MKEAVIVDACRSPIGRAGDRGVYRSITGRDLMRPALRAIVERNKLDPAKIDDIVLGSAGGGWGGRSSSLLANFPDPLKQLPSPRTISRTMMPISS
jgi:acetyl-CoA C-acetyltransferase